MTMTGPPRVAWAPPLDPSTSGGLPIDQAEALAAALWDECPHCAAAAMWEAYAATLPPELAVSQVVTGVQSVSYGSARPGGQFGLAIGRAEWHRSMCGGLGSVPLRAGTPRRARTAWC